MLKIVIKLKILFQDLESLLTHVEYMDKAHIYMWIMEWVIFPKLLVE